MPNQNANNTKKRRVPITWKCPKCNRRFTPSKALRSELANLRKAKIKCHQCGGISSQPNHKPNHHPNPISNVPNHGSSSRNVRQVKKRITSTAKAAKRGTIIPMTANVSAERFFILQTLNPKATMGSRTIKLKADDTQLPTVGYNFNSVFTVALNGSSGEDMSFKIKFLPSPVIVAQIYSQQPITVHGHRAFSIPDGQGYLTSVIGSKIGQLGDIDDQYNFTPKLDWSKYRCIGYSAGSSWVGREIDKSGVVYAARMNEETRLADFDPTAKQDSIYGRAFQEQSFSGMHKEPVYDWTFTDPNQAAVEEPNLQPSHHTIKYNDSCVAYPLDKGAYTLTENDPPNVLPVSRDTDPDRIVQRIFDRVISNGYLENQLMAFNRQWNILTQIGRQFTFGHNLTVNWTFVTMVIPGEPQSNAVRTGEFTLVPGTSPMNFSTGTFVNEVLLGPLITAYRDNFIEGSLHTISIDLLSSIRLQSRNVQYHKPSSVTRNIITQQLADETDYMFLDDTWAAPVADYRFAPVSGGTVADIMMQFVHVTNYELIVSDTSIINNFTTAQASNSKDTVIDSKSTRLQKIMRGMPPMITFDSGCIGQTAQTELASRGIIADIANFLGPIASTIFPEFAPIINVGQSLANKFDSLGII